MVLLVMSGIVGAIAIGVIGYVQGEHSLRRATWDQLVSIRETKKACFERWTDQQLREFRILSSDQQLVSAAADFRRGFDDLGPTLTDAEQQRLLGYYRDTFVPQLPANIDDRAVDTYLPDTNAGARLQLDYIVDNPNPAGKKYLLETRSESVIAGDAVDAYDAAHRAYHPTFVRLMNETQLYDLFLIDAETGDVLYTTQKEADLGTSLIDGPYHLSGLATAFERARTGDVGDAGVVLVDFKHYTASFGAPAAFLAAPITDNGKVVAVVAGQVSIDALNNAMTSNGNWKDEGLGASGESYLVGPDMTARTDSRFLIEDKADYLATLTRLGVDDATVQAIDTSGHSILNQSIETGPVRAALDGKTGTSTIADYRGIEVMSAYAPVMVGGERWAILIEKDVSEALDPMYRMRRNILLATGAAAIVLTLLALWSARAFLRPIVRLQDGVERLKSGDVDFSIDAEGHDEFASLGRAFNEMIAEVRQRNRTIAEKTAEYEKLLRNVLPDAVADRMRGGDQVVADTFRNVSIGYISIDGLPRLMHGLDATATIKLLNELVDSFDDAAERHGVEKVRTIGDAYLAACGLSTPRLDHRQRMSSFAHEALAIVERFNAAKGCDLQLQIGMASGEVDAGIVGRHRFVYEILGGCVADARRLASAGDQPGVHMTPEFEQALSGTGQDGQ
ncbi:unannotated protein [freshwater metagenome]|uniref:Unannotated protein n=1 Tax=freshwater metagenome TaxID=449393 RepID=A0A6J7EUW8_9ZZZZ